MLVSSFLTLAIALLAIYISINATDEIVQLAATLVVGLCLFLGLIFSPWLIKLFLLMAILIVQKQILALIQAPQR